MPSRRFVKRVMEQRAQNSRGTHAFCPHTLLKTVLSSSSFLLVLLSCPHGLSARCFPSCRPDTASSAPVCCCHWDSLTRGRLAFALEAVRDSLSLSPRLVLHVLACAR